MVVSDYSNYDDREEWLDPDIVLRISEQLVDAVTFLHEAGYAHGDISSRNIVFTCNHLSQASKEDLFNILGPPESENLTRLDGEPSGDSLPKQLVKTVGWDNWTEEDEEDLRIIDFGEAFLQGGRAEKACPAWHFAKAGNNL
ncbi:hypothetical protein HO173_000129 [Letharia columbiana]|uniref:Protein kinase domain-containing protein n=1 Tax=Letharia columbiana TaxID=112416 RepID=A0A8H6G6R7_9LECA|nr:uncharacterized protein HO173_000129 [Letharia columbiana]KAF6241419.1 hypothetical protein HO173_000129 [Letharia columbiana]